MDDIVLRDLCIRLCEHQWIGNFYHSSGPRDVYSTTKKNEMTTISPR